MKLKFCKNELDMFEECYHDPVSYAKFEEVATKNQKEIKNYFAHITKKEYIH